MAIVGTHQINMRLAKDSILSKLKLDAEIEFEELNYKHEKSFGTDTWVLNAGKVLSEMLALCKQSKDNDGSLRIYDVSITKFKKGLMQWSTHEVSVSFSYDLQRNNLSIKKGRIEGNGSGKGTEFGWLTFIPVLGNINFDKGIELALSRSIESAIGSLAFETKDTLN